MNAITANIIKGPADVTAIVGESLLLPCEMSGDLNQDNVFGWRVDRKYEENVIIFETPPDILHDRDMYNETGRFNLYIGKVSLTHAGYYTCYHGNQDRSAHVVVMGKINLIKLYSLILIKPSNL